MRRRLLCVLVCFVSAVSCGEPFFLESPLGRLHGPYDDADGAGIRVPSRDGQRLTYMFLRAQLLAADGKPLEPRGDPNALFEIEGDWLPFPK